jgi:hypothetical protein
MSAYIVDRKVIHRIVTAICTERSHDCAAREIARRLGTLLSTEALPVIRAATNIGTAIGHELWKMNLDAVSQRYPRDKSGERPGPIDFKDSDVDEYVYEPQPLNFEATGKTIDDDFGSLIYQCSEGDVPQSQLYRGLVELQGILAVQYLRAKLEDERDREDEH